MNKVEIEVTNNTIKWYTSKGYIIPTHTVQLWATKDGTRVKNGNKVRVKKGTKIWVKLNDLPPSSNKNITLTCSWCGENFTTTFRAYKEKEESDRCTTCAKKRLKGDGSHSYWVKTLITDNLSAKCDISGETDKRFLVLHHLNSKGLGGRNTSDNYVILSANYHMAFHVSCGGTNVQCTKEDYMKFKQKELSQTDVLAEDWVVLDDQPN